MSNVGVDGRSAGTNVGVDASAAIATGFGVESWKGVSAECVYSKVNCVCERLL